MNLLASEEASFPCKKFQAVTLGRLLTVSMSCPQLVLRKWSELIPGGEFRCFVKENKLIGNDLMTT